MTEEIPQLREGIADIKDLSFTDIFILQYLQRFQGPTVRIVLLETLNSFMKGDEMSPSSFYNRLKRLKKKGFVIETNERSRGQKVDITPLAIQALSRISQISMMGSIDFYQHTLNILNEIQRDIPELQQLTKNLLIINLEEGLDLNTLNLIANFAENTYIAANDTTYSRYIGRGMPEEIIQSQLNDHTIREPDAWFDKILIIGYECGTHHHPQDIWLGEAHRLLKSGGLVIVTTLSEFPETDHFVLNQLAQDMAQNEFIKQSSNDELISDLKKNNLKDVKIKDYRGQILIWGQKP